LRMLLESKMCYNTRTSGHTKFVNEQVGQFVHDVTHPEGTVPHLWADISHEPDPVRRLKKAMIEDIQSAKVRIAGVG
jgi:hypothetical protein